MSETKELYTVSSIRFNGPAGQSKYGNQPTVVDGIRFDSKAEANRYSELRLLERGGAISDLTIHPRYELQCPDLLAGQTEIKHQTVCVYEADFRYYDPERGWVVEDVKGARTDVYRIKKKWLKLQYRIDITEIEV